jgi:hypothetical protein
MFFLSDCLLMEGSGSGRPKDIRIRSHNTAKEQRFLKLANKTRFQSFQPHFLFNVLVWAFGIMTQVQSLPYRYLWTTAFNNLNLRYTQQLRDRKKHRLLKIFITIVRRTDETRPNFAYFFSKKNWFGTVPRYRYGTGYRTICPNIPR